MHAGERSGDDVLDSPVRVTDVAGLRDAGGRCLAEADRVVIGSVHNRVERLAELEVPMGPAWRWGCQRLPQSEGEPHRPHPRGLGQTHQPVGVRAGAHHHAPGLDSSAAGQSRSSAVDAYGLAELQVQSGLQEANRVLGVSGSAGGLEKPFVLRDGERMLRAAETLKTAVGRR